MSTRGLGLGGRWTGREIGILAGNVERCGGGQSDNDDDSKQEQIQYPDGV